MVPATNLPDHVCFSLHALVYLNVADHNVFVVKEKNIYLQLPTFVHLASSSPFDFGVDDDTLAEKNIF